MKTEIELLIEILDKQRATVLACEVDTVIYTRKNLIVKDAQSSAYFTKKLEEIKAVKQRAEETIEVIKKMIAERGDKKSIN